MKQNRSSFCFKTETPEGFLSKRCLTNFTKFTGKHLCWSLFLNKVAGLLKKETPAQLFSCEFGLIFKNNFFYRTPPVAATDSCRDGWNVQIGDGWNVRDCLNMNFLKLVKIWIWILQNLRCLSCKSTNFVLVVKPRLMSLFWLFGLCLFGLLFAMYDW